MMKICSVCKSPYFSKNQLETEAVCQKLSCRHQFERHKQTVSERIAADFSVEPGIPHHEGLQQVVGRLRTLISENKTKSADAMREDRQNRALYRRVLRNADGLIQHEYPLVVLAPYQPKAIAKLPEERKQAYLSHIRVLIEQAVKSREGDNDTSTADQKHIGYQDEERRKRALDTLNGLVCTVCKGRCCRAPTNKAYLTAETIKRYIRQNPKLTAEQVFLNYKGRLAERTYSNSCIHHTEYGCNLPKEMRSDTCNNFYCASLTKLHKNIAEQAVDIKGVVVISRSRNVRTDENSQAIAKAELVELDLLNCNSSN